MKTYPLRKKPLKPSGSEYYCQCGHTKREHIEVIIDGLMPLLDETNECTICECPKYEPDKNKWWP